MVLNMQALVICISIHRYLTYIDARLVVNRLLQSGHLNVTSKVFKVLKDHKDLMVKLLDGIQEQV